MSISIVLADDHLIVRRGVRAVLEAESDLKIVGEAEDGAAVLELVARLRPDVLLLDLMMPVLGGLQVLRELAERREPTRTVVLSIYATEVYVTEALRVGATGYVIKNATDGDLVRAVRDAAEGRRFLSPPLSDSLIDAYTRRIQDTTDDPYDKLTAREREVLLLTAQGHTAGEISARLNISPRTAESHRANLMQKIGLRNQSELIRFALRRGLLDPHA